MAGLLPLARVHHLRGFDLAIARRVDRAAHIGFEFAPDEIALGMPEDRPMRFLLKVEQVHLRAQLAVVALARFLQLVEMRLQLLLVQPASAVNTAEHRILLIASPIGARYAGQLERGGVEPSG
jgi:hypothetical protein